jgi:hypothetical protein
MFSYPYSLLPPEGDNIRLLHLLSNENEAALSRLRDHSLEPIMWVDAVCLYIDRYQRKYHKNLRFRPPFSAGFRFCISDQLAAFALMSRLDHA